MKPFSWVKIVIVLMVLAAINLVAPPVDTVVNNRMAMEQMKPSDAGYVGWTTWSNSDRLGALSAFVVVAGVLVMLPEIIAAFKRQAE